MERTHEDLIKELDGINRTRERYRRELEELLGGAELFEVGGELHKAYLRFERRDAMMLKQWAHVVKLLGIEGMKTYTALQVRRVAKKRLRAQRKQIERARVGIFGKQAAVSISKEKCEIREANGIPSINQGIRPVDEIRGLMFPEDK